MNSESSMRMRTDYIVCTLCLLIDGKSILVAGTEFIVLNNNTC